MAVPPRILTAATLAAALLACTGGGDAGAPATPTTAPTQTSAADLGNAFTSPDGVLSFRYPSGWTVDTASAGPQAWFLTNFALESGGGHLRDGMAKIDFSQEPAEGTTLDELRADLCLESDPREDEGLEVLDCSTVEIGGAEWARSFVDDESFDSKALALGAVFAGTIYRAVAFVPNGEEQGRLLAAVEEIFATLRLEQPAG